MAKSSRDKRSQDYLSLSRQRARTAELDVKDKFWIARASNVSNLVMVLVGALVAAGGTYLIGTIFKSAESEVTSLQKQVMVLNKELDEVERKYSVNRKEIDMLTKDIKVLSRARDTRICQSEVRKRLSPNTALVVDGICAGFNEDEQKAPSPNVERSNALEGTKTM